jgi:hypothetical protein
MANVNVNLTFQPESDVKCTLLQTLKGVQFRGQGQSGVIPGTVTVLNSQQTQLRTILLPDTSGTVIVNPTVLTVPIILDSNVVEIGNTTASSITEILSPIQTYTSSLTTLTTGSPSISAAAYLGRLIDFLGSSPINAQIDTATNFIAALSAAGGTPYIGETINCKIVNAGTAAITLTAASDSSITLVGSVTIAASTAAELVLRITNVTTGTLAGILYT